MSWQLASNQKRGCLTSPDFPQSYTLPASSLRSASLGTTLTAPKPLCGPGPPSAAEAKPPGQSLIHVSSAVVRATVTQRQARTETHPRYGAASRSARLPRPYNTAQCDPATTHRCPVTKGKGHHRIITAAFSSPPSSPPLHFRTSAPVCVWPLHVHFHRHSTLVRSHTAPPQIPDFFPSLSTVLYAPLSEETLVGAHTQGDQPLLSYIAELACQSPTPNECPVAWGW
ncbi:hypothetical protein B0T14DRAFT_41301 [Immersiella caudata]|uniref:Uncharacterized protein n=1 Tax=Immersiella caudata TaxID=314043 RepID=A0AA39XEY9_9PEZI|nr:hypothetical protein B0T14DRAFT_41301 [Immersiella caudata]